jgi:hypothetical protein
VDTIGVNDRGAEELDGACRALMAPRSLSLLYVPHLHSRVTAAAGIIVLDDADSDVDVEQMLEQTPALMRARLNDASEHESRMRSTISSARRFALDLERTGAPITLHARHLPTLHSFPCQCLCQSWWASRRI